MQKDIALKSVNWLGAEPISETPQNVFVKIRSTRPAVEASLYKAGAKVVVTVPNGEYGVSPGQASVFYDEAGTGARVLGGGFIAASGL